MCKTPQPEQPPSEHDQELRMMMVDSNNEIDLGMDLSPVQILHLNDYKVVESSHRKGDKEELIDQNNYHSNGSRVSKGLLQEPSRRPSAMLRLASKGQHPEGR